MNSQGNGKTQEELSAKNCLQKHCGKKSTVVIALGIILFLALCVTDGVHQKELADVALAQEQAMEGCQAEALQVFEQYLRHGELYFLLSDFVNGKDSPYSRNTVLQYAAYCRECIDGKGETD